MQHPPGAGDAEVALQVTVVVPGQGCHPGAVLESQGVEGVHQLLGTAREPAVRGAAHLAGGEPGDHLHLGVVDSGVREEQPAVELDVHHRHRGLS